MTAPTPVQFLPECYADTAVVWALLRQNDAHGQRLRPFVNHEHGIGNVDKNLQAQAERFGASRRVVGVVDLDKKFDKLPYLPKFRLVEGNMIRRQSSHVVLRHPEQHSQFLIVLNPACDRWLWDRAAELGKTPADFGLPATFEAFTEYCKSKPAEQGLRPLLAAIAKARHPAYRALADFVALIMDLTRPLPNPEGW